MWDEVRNDPFLRTIAVIIVGILLFGLLFNTVPGSAGAMNSGEHMATQARGYGYSFSSIIGWLLFMLVRILLVVLIGAVLIGVFLWIRNAFFRDNNSALVKAINNDPMLKTVVIITLSIIGLFIVLGLLGNFSTTGYTGSSGNMGYGGSMTGEHMGGAYYGYNPAFSLNWLLISLVKVLSYVLLISLAIAFAIYLKNQYESGRLSWAMGDKKSIDINTNEDKSNRDNLDSTV